MKLTGALPFTVRHKVDTVLFMPFGWAKLHAGALQALDNDPGEGGRPRSAHDESKQLDEQQRDTSSKKEPATISETSS